MKKYLFLTFILCTYIPLSSQMKDDFLSPPRKSHLILNTIVMHDHSVTYKEGFRPKNAVESLGSRGVGKMSLYTTYISTNNSDAGEHIQRIELYTPGKKKLVYKSGKKFQVKDATPTLGKFQRGYLEQTIIFPQLTRNKKNFGLYVISIYLNDVWMRDFLVPVFAW